MLRDVLLRSLHCVYTIFSFYVTICLRRCWGLLEDNNGNEYLNLSKTIFRVLNSGVLLMKAPRFIWITASTRLQRFFMIEQAFESSIPCNKQKRSMRVYIFKTHLPRCLFIKFNYNSTIKPFHPTKPINSKSQEIKTNKSIDYSSSNQTSVTR